MGPPRAAIAFGRRNEDEVPGDVTMPVETFEFVLLLSGWVVAFLLGRELQSGFRQWRLRTAEQRARIDD